MTGGRRKSREVAFQALYEIDSTGHKVEEVLSYLIEKEKLSEENASFACNLITGVIHNKERIDRNIQTFAPAFPIEQMAVVDRNILRIATFEILLDNTVPFKVVINEAVELAKTFGSNSSARFVNGVLGSVSNLVTG